jgi:hypothetical protein
MVGLFAPTVLLFTSAVMAQAQTPSVVTSQSVGPVPTTEGVFTIQTSVPGLSTSACYEVCFQAPCAPCAHPPRPAADTSPLTSGRRRDVGRLHGHPAWRNADPESAALKRRRSQQWRASTLQQHQPGQHFVQGQRSPALGVWQCAGAAVDFSGVGVDCAWQRNNIQDRLGRVESGSGWRFFGSLKSWDPL